MPDLSKGFILGFCAMLLLVYSGYVNSIRDCELKAGYGHQCRLHIVPMDKPLDTKQTTK